MAGASRAFATVVLRRGNSRICGRISDESETEPSGNSSLIISPRARSCSGFRNEKRSTTATDSAPFFLRRRTASRACSTSSGFFTLPW